MNSNKHVVYDSRNSFARFLKYEFRNSFDFDSYRKFDSFENEIDNYSTILFVIYSEEDLDYFMKIYKKGVKILACTFNYELFCKIQSIYEIPVFDISKLKSEVRLELNPHLV
ncbi:hypothetical protein [Flavobacterium cellulosilyticum]|uniref:Uncharacterized protein n=1 Tax=Flavobacterium cellulosilyticum TaxID=2541731 RepID=A0A4R5CJE4_9FLAO|nr:hypothetical protein [Flavobacterium cellulosilyticum]TDD98443.1 hypothetical protein E0F76_04715 [Flavobacterium cellulosilyticum]